VLALLQPFREHMGISVGSQFVFALQHLPNSTRFFVVASTFGYFTVQDGRLAAIGEIAKATQAAFDGGSVDALASYIESYIHQRPNTAR
jgi:hypothetical protein